MKHIPTRTFWPVFIFFLLLYGTFRFFGDQLIGGLLDLGGHGLLNVLLGGHGREPFEFYAGMGEDVLLGPMSQIIGGFLFLAVLRRFFRGVPFKSFAFLVFLFLLITKAEVLTFPPYGDAIGGPFAEAIWLKDHGFNYAGLLQEPGYAEGGPRAYFFSLYPGYLALLMTLLSFPPVFFLVNHMIVFLMAAVMAALVREIGRKIFSEHEATILALIMLSISVFQAQTEAINMELPTGFFVLLSAYFLLCGHIHRAGTMAVLAVLIKGTGLTACAGIVAAAVAFWGDRSISRDVRARLLVWGGGLVGFAVIAVGIKFLLHDQHVSQGMVRPLVGWPSLKTFMISKFFLVASLVIAVHSVRVLLQRGEKGGDVVWERTAAVMYLYALMWFLLFLNFYAVSSRYRMPLYPFLVFSLYYAFTLIIKDATIKKIALSGVFFLTLAGSYGILDGHIRENDHVVLEKSLEYRNDLRLQRQAVRYLEDRYGDHKIGAPFIAAQMLALPELGYVRGKLDVMIYGYRCTYADIETYPGMQALDPRRTVYVGYRESEEAGFPFPVSPQDAVLAEFRRGNKDLRIFAGGFAIERKFRSAQWQQLQMMRQRSAEGQPSSAR